MSQPINPGQSTKKSKTRRSDAAARAAEALRLRLSGLDYAEIATRLGYKDKSGAWRAVEGELRKVRHERASQVVTLDLARLDLLLKAVWDKALLGDPVAFDRVMRVLDRRAKYFDLDGQAGFAADQVRAVQELAYAEALVSLAELKDKMQGRLVGAIAIELSRAASGLPEPEIPWERATALLEDYEDNEIV